MPGGGGYTAHGVTSGGQQNPEPISARRAGSWRDASSAVGEWSQMTRSGRTILNRLRHAEARAVSALACPHPTFASTWANERVTGNGLAAAALRSGSQGAWR